MNSPGMVAGGIAMMAAGTPAIAFGGFLVAAASSSGVDCFQGPCEQPDMTWASASGATLIAGGLGLIGGGIALVVVGAQAEEHAAASGRLLLTPTGAALRGAF